MPNPSLASILARAFLAGDPAPDAILRRSSHALGRNWRWLRPLAHRYMVAHTPQKPRPRHRDVVAFLLADSGFRLALSKYSADLSIAHWLTDAQQMHPVPAASSWPIPPLTSVADLADFLSLYPAELDWFADLKALCNISEIPSALTHYRYRIVNKSHGNIRVIEAPKPNLKAIQKRILTGILDNIPPHSAAHGFNKGRSIRTFTAPHVNRPVVLRVDIQDFFPSISGARIQAFFRTAGYPEPLADLLGGICTNAMPRHAWDRPVSTETRGLYARPHLPQGAPTSPSLANVCFWRVDCRLTGLAESASATYTRYADDLAFSGSVEFNRGIARFSSHVAAILLEEGFTTNHRKTRIMRPAVRQHLAGIVINQRPNVPRPEFDLLKAILTNCVRLGPESQNRASHPSFKAHLEGRISFVESLNPEKAKRLRAIFERISWL